MGRVNLFGEVGPNGSDKGFCSVFPTIGVLREDVPVERLVRRDGGSVIAVDADPTSDAECIDSDEVLDE
jgi:hypothetical protein